MCFRATRAKQKNPVSKNKTISVKYPVFLKFIITFTFDEYVCGCTHAMTHVWRSEDKLLLSSYHMGPGDQTQIIRFGSKYLYLLTYLSNSFCFETWPHYIAPADFEFEIFLPLSPEAWDYRCVPPCLVLSFNFL